MHLTGRLSGIDEDVEIAGRLILYSDYEGESSTPGEFYNSTMVYSIQYINKSSIDVKLYYIYYMGENMTNNVLFSFNNSDLTVIISY